VDQDEFQNVLSPLIIAELGEEVVESIRADERELIIEFLRSDEWADQSCDDAANALEDCEHYEGFDDYEDLH